MGIFLEGEDSHGDHGLGRLVEFRFKAPPGATSPSNTTHTSSGQRNCASWTSQPQKSVTFLPCSGGRTTKSTKRTCGGIGKKEKKNFSLYPPPPTKKTIISKMKQWATRNIQKRRVPVDTAIYYSVTTILNSTACFDLFIPSHFHICCVTATLHTTQKGLTLWRRNYFI